MKKTITSFFAFVGLMIASSQAAQAGLLGSTSLTTLAVSVPRLNSITVIFENGTDASSGLSNNVAFEHRDGDPASAMGMLRDGQALLRLWLHGADAVNAVRMDLRNSYGYLVASTFNPYTGVNSCNSNLTVDTSHCVMATWLSYSYLGGSYGYKMFDGTYTLTVRYRDGSTRLHTFQFVSYGMIPLQGMVSPGTTY